MATTIEVITSPDCIRSPKAMRLAQQVAGRMGGVLLYEINTISEAGRQYASMLQVEATPAIVVNGKVAYVGVPKKELMEKLLRN